jgi:type II secretory pathway pseudopilin PulG
MIRRRLQAFSLIEIVLAMALSAIVLAMGLAQTGHWRGKSSCRGEAQSVAELVRSLREQAGRLQQPVALVMPTAAGTQPFAQSLYVLTGATLPKVTQVINFKTDYPDAYLFQGYWSLDPALLRDPTRLNSTDLPTGGQQLGSFDASTWGMPSPADYALIFLPSGAVVSNGLPNFDGDYHLVICQSFAASPGVQPPGPGSALAYFNLTSALEPYTVKVTAAGQVEVVPGVLGSSTVAGQSGSVPAAPAPPARYNGSNHAPLAQSGDISVTPAYDPSVLTGGANWGCALDSQVTIAVKATDPDGDPLFCQWSPSTGGSFSASDGQFSTSAVPWQPMQFRNGFWEARCSWRPPALASAGQVFNLDCQVNDMRGGTLHLGGGVVTLMKAQVRNPATIWASDTQAIYKINSDGIIVNELPIPPALVSLCTTGVSRDGRKLAAGVQGSDLATCNADGSSLVKLNFAYDCCDPDLALGGRLVMTNTEDHSIWVSDHDGTNPTRVTSPSPQLDEDPMWSSDGKKVAFYRSDSDGSNPRIMVLDIVTSSLTDLGPGFSPCWSPDDTSLCFRRSDGVYVQPSNGASAAVQVVSVATDSSPSLAWLDTNTWTNDGSQLVYLDPSYAPRICNPDGSNDRSLINTALNLRSVRASW